MFAKSILERNRVFRQLLVYSLGTKVQREIIRIYNKNKFPKLSREIDGV